MKLEQMKIKELLDTSHTIAEKLFEGHEYPWEVLGDINGFIESLGASFRRTNTRRLERISGFTRQHRWLPPLPWADL